MVESLVNDGMVVYFSWSTGNVFALAADGGGWRDLLYLNRLLFCLLLIRRRGTSKVSLWLLFNQFVPESCINAVRGYKGILI